MQLSHTSAPTSASFDDPNLVLAAGLVPAVKKATAAKTHRAHAVIEQVNADPKDSALAHLPSGKFNANAAWLVLATIPFNLTRAAATIAGDGLSRRPRERSGANWLFTIHGVAGA